MKCENCAAYNAKVIYINATKDDKGDKYVLCNKCRKLLMEIE